MAARIVASLRHVPVERTLAHRSAEVLVFRQRRMAIREFHHAPSAITRAVEAIPPIVFLLAGAALVVVGGLMLKPTGDRGTLAALVCASGIGLVLLALLQVAVIGRLRPPLPEPQRSVESDAFWLVRFDARTRRCRLLGPLSSTVAEGDLAATSEPVAAEVAWSRVKVAVSEPRSSPWSDLHDQPPWDDEDASGLDGVGLKVIGIRPRIESEPPDFAGRFWLPSPQPSEATWLDEKRRLEAFLGRPETA